MIIYSDYPGLSVERHTELCQDVIALCQLYEIPFDQMGIHGSIPYVGVSLPGVLESRGKIHMFKVGTGNLPFNLFIFDFNPTSFGIKDAEFYPGEGWGIHL